MSMKIHTAVREDLQTRQHVKGLSLLTHHKALSPLSFDPTLMAAKISTVE
jgi:hypothetical protein